MNNLEFCVHQHSSAQFNRKKRYILKLLNIENHRNNPINVRRVQLKHQIQESQDKNLQRLKERQTNDVSPSPILCPRFRSLFSLRLALFPRPFLAPAPDSANTPFHNSSAVTVKTHTHTNLKICQIFIFSPSYLLKTRTREKKRIVRHLTTTQTLLNTQNKIQGLHQQIIL